MNSNEISWILMNSYEFQGILMISFEIIWNLILITRGEDPQSNNSMDFEGLGIRGRPATCWISSPAARTGKGEDSQHTSLPRSGRHHHFWPEAILVLPIAALRQALPLLIVYKTCLGVWFTYWGWTPQVRSKWQASKSESLWTFEANYWRGGRWFAICFFAAKSF